METFRISLEGYAGGARPGVPLSFSFWPEVPMTRERALKVVLVLVGLLFSAAAYPLLAMHLQEALRMMLSVYATLGIFLLLASRDPSANSWRRRCARSSRTGKSRRNFPPKRSRNSARWAAAAC